MKKSKVRELFGKFLNDYGIEINHPAAVEFLSNFQKKEKVIKHICYVFDEKDFDEFEFDFANTDVEEVEDFLNEVMDEGWDDLPSFSFDKGGSPDAEDGMTFFVKLRDNIFSFDIYEGDAVEISWSHSIYETDIKNVKYISQRDYDKYNFVFVD